eukprot:2891545-Prymnesium_polylepis.1
MSLFEPNSGRGADVFAASDGIIGLFTFDGLQEFMEVHPLLGLKTMRAIGLSTVTKLLHERGRVLRAKPALKGFNANEKKEALDALLNLASSSELFSLFEPHELQTLHDASKIVRFASGDTLLHRGQEMPFTAIILKGTVEAMADSALPPETIGPGALLCPTLVFLGQNATQPKLVVATSDGCMLTFTYDETLVALAESSSPVLCEKLCKLCALVAMAGLRNSRGQGGGDLVKQVKQAGLRRTPERDAAAGKEEVFLRGRTLREQGKGTSARGAPPSGLAKPEDRSLEQKLEIAQREASNYKLLLQARARERERRGRGRGRGSEGVHGVCVRARR